MFVTAGNFRICYLICLLTSGALLLFSCGDNSKRSAELEKRFREADSTVLAGDNNKGTLLFKKLRAQLHDGDPVLCQYYTEFCLINYDNKTGSALYADSALNFFNSVNRIKKYPELYALAELRKGDAYYYGGKYTLALTHYFRSQENMPPKSSLEAELASKIGSIYFGQTNYKAAAKYWAESYRLTNATGGNLDKRRFFFQKQGDLSNTGFCFELAGMPDSAERYYLADIAWINGADTTLIKSTTILAALTVVYDNFGGLKIKQGDLKTAESYLLKSLSYPVADKDGIHIPPIIKLIDVYLKEGKLKKLPPLFARSKKLIDKFYSANRSAAEKWNELYAYFLFKTGRVAEAYQYQHNFVQIRDTLQNMRNDMNRIDVDRELSRMHQDEVLTALQLNDKQTKVYILGVSVIAVMLLLIGFLIYRNLKRTTVYNMQLQTALADVERVNKNYMRVMRVMAHDIINPLAGITGIASLLLLKKSLPEKTKQDIRLIESSGLHSMQMIKELLRMGLADEQEENLLEPIDISGLVKDSVELLKFKAGDKNQEIIFEDNPTPIIADVNKDKIWRLVNNIIANAIKFSHKGGTIKVGLKRVNNSVLFTVADNGVGIPEQNRQHIFEMFTPAKRAGTGGEQPFGLGLSISKKIVEKHNGQIWFEDNPEGGTIFFVQLPISN